MSLQKKRCFSPKQSHTSAQKHKKSKRGIGAAQQTGDALPSALDAEQQRAVDQVLAGRNVFLTGAAGVGKSLCIGEVVHQAIQRKWRVAVTATTGLAAQGLAALVERDNVVPTTVHRFAGLVPNEYDVDALVQRVQRNAFLANRWRSTTLWIIDEVSMLSPVIFVLLDRMARALRRQPSTPFGGIIMLFVGDFFQLPPVVIDEAECRRARELAAVRYGHTRKESANDDNGDSDIGEEQTLTLDPHDTLEYCFETNEWRNAIDCAILLRRVYRQSGDDGFVDILNQVRHAKLSPEAVETLRSRTFDALYDDVVKLAGLDPRDMPDIDAMALRAQLAERGMQIPRRLMPLLSAVEPTKLLARNAMVNAENETRLAELDAPQVYYEAQTACSGSGVRSAQQQKALRQQIESGVRAQKSLQLRRGAQVMLLANLSDSLVNGSRGVVLDFCEHSEQREAYEQASNAAVQEEWARVAGCAADEPLLWPLVRFDNGDERLMTPHTWQRRSKRPAWRATFTQVPLQLAWAMSIHKSQGMSISLLTVDLQQLFASGQAYVALSRARSLDGLMLESFEPSMCIDATQAPNRKVLRYYRALERATPLPTLH